MLTGNRANSHPRRNMEGPSCTIRILDGVHFCATKVESFLGRGQGDFFHHDIEDVVAIVDARAEPVRRVCRSCLIGFDGSQGRGEWPVFQLLDKGPVRLTVLRCLRTPVWPKAG